MTNRQAIRALFLNRQFHYTPAEVAAVLGWDESEMVEAIVNGDIEAYQEGDSLAISWEEVAAMATAKWPQAVIEAALGNETDSVIPELVRLSELRVRVPRYEIVMLTKLAQRDGTTVDDYLARHLLDLAAAEYDWLREVAPQIEQAVRWPEN